MPEKANEEINLFIRDEITGRYVFNPKALRALGIDPTMAQERGFQIMPERKATSEPVG